MLPVIHPIVSLSPPMEIAFLIQSSKSTPSKKCDNRLGNAVLTSTSPCVRWSNTVTRKVKIILELTFYLFSNIFFRSTTSRHKYCKCCGLGTFYPLRMVVGTFSTFFCFGENFRLCIKSPSNRADTHGRTIATTVIWSEIILSNASYNPAFELFTIASKWPRILLCISAIIMGYFSPFRSQSAVARVRILSSV